MTSTAPSPLRTWLQLLRAPNLFTVPGDPLAGFLLASSGQVDSRLVCAILASLCFYAHGLLLNDLADLAEDRRDRPERPLPSGAASLGCVRIVAAALAVVALVLCFVTNGPALLTGSALLVAIILYNFYGKKIAVVGPINMGLCRGLSLLLGASAWLSPHGENWNAISLIGTLPSLVFFAAIGLTLYIAAITHLARIETLADPPPLPRTLPYLALAFVIATFFLAAIDRTHPLASSNLWLYILSAYTLYAGYRIHDKLAQRPPPPIPPMIGQLIRLLLPLQAVFSLASRSLAGAVTAIFLILLWPISRAVSQRFYAS